MTRRTAPLPARGSALVLVIILLAAMATISVAIVKLSGQARIRAAAQSSHDALTECANAAKALLWSAVAVNGKSYYEKPTPEMRVISLRLPDGRELVAPAHLGGATSSLTVPDGIRAIASSNPAGSTGDKDMTNRLNEAGGGGKASTWVTVRCTDSSGRTHEVEFAFKFSL